MISLIWRIYETVSVALKKFYFNIVADRDEGKEKKSVFLLIFKLAVKVVYGHMDKEEHSNKINNYCCCCWHTATSFKLF